MQSFVTDENIFRCRKLIAAAAADPSRDEARYQILLRLLADEEAKLEDAYPPLVVIIQTAHATHARLATTVPTESQKR